MTLLLSIASCALQIRLCFYFVLQNQQNQALDALFFAEMTLHISDAEFLDFQSFVYQSAGISMHAGKKALICGRLSKRLQHHHLHSYGEYFALINSREGEMERQICIDLLTTNETYFFREPKHFEWLVRHLHALPASGQPLRVWSAACSSGEEVYSLAMTLAEHCQQPWQVAGSDISTRVLERARSAHYAMVRAKNIPEPYLKKYCLRGTGSQEGTFLIHRSLRERVDFTHINLNAPLPQIGLFDVIFLRNVMIYFDSATKQSVIQRLTQQLRPGGYLCIGHSESLNDIYHDLVMQRPSIFTKPVRGHAR